MECFFPLFSYSFLARNLCNGLRCSIAPTAQDTQSLVRLHGDLGAKVLLICPDLGQEGQALGTKILKSHHRQKQVIKPQSVTAGRDGEQSCLC